MKSDDQEVMVEADTQLSAAEHGKMDNAIVVSYSTAGKCSLPFLAFLLLSILSTLLASPALSVLSVQHAERERVQKPLIQYQQSGRQ